MIEAIVDRLLLMDEYVPNDIKESRRGLHICYWQNILQRIEETEDRTQQKILHLSLIRVTFWAYERAERPRLFFHIQELIR